MLQLLKKAESEYTVHNTTFTLQKRRKNWEPLYKNLKAFEKFNDEYFALNDKTMESIEKHARHPDEFVKFK
ncbi:MAG TPA: hypothetical protein VF609_08410 [Flavisolibacter sp.]|jgi:uncharacterized membrane protein